MTTKELAAKIIARNRVNAYIKQYAPQIFAALKPFEGKKIVLASGELAAPVKKAIQGFFGNIRVEDNKTIQIYPGSLSYSFSLVFKTSEPYKEFSVVYQESFVYFANIRDGILIDFYSFDAANYRSDYTLDEITAIQAELAAAEAKVDQIKGKLPPFARN